MARLLGALAVLGAMMLSAGAVQACPDWRLAGQELYYSGDELYTPRYHGVVAGGNVDLRKCRTAQGAVGFVAAAPDFELYFSGSRNYTLELRVVSECDSVLLINTGNANWYFDDDDNGNLDAMIRLTRPSEGWYDIWIGALDRNCNARLELETF
ncbi:MAG: hypothetical protein AAGE18_03630 [Pseudomonadota bacterium]